MVIIDPGHGGKDSGAVGPNETKEKDIVLSISKFVSEILNYRGYENRLTRDDDSYPSWGDRLQSNPKDLFISIHCNAVANKKVRGVETWHFTNSENGKKIASLIQDNIIKSSQMRDRGIKNNKKFRVLKDTRCPAVLVETGFISNPKEEEILNSLSYQIKVACSIVDAIKEYEG